MKKILLLLGIFTMLSTIAAAERGPSVKASFTPSSVEKGAETTFSWSVVNAGFDDSDCQLEGIPGLADDSVDSSGKIVIVASEDLHATVDCYLFTYEEDEREPDEEDVFGSARLKVTPPPQPIPPIDPVPSRPKSISAPISDSDGAFTVTWSGSIDKNSWFVLQQQLNGGSYSTIYQGALLYKSVSGLTNGIYRYRVNACNDSLQCSKWAHSKQIAVTNATPIAEGTPPVTPNAVAEEPPTHDATAGAIAGQFRVDESGQANYSIQIATVAGSGGVTPQVGLRYSSQGGNGILGVGWSISGQSAISRCRRTFEQDGINAAVDLTANDRFCLSGQRLMVVTGSYGAPNSTYKPEIDSQVEVTALGGTLGNPQHFEVRAKDGSITEYGNSTDSRLYSNATGLSDRTTTWAQSKFTDNAGLVNSNSYTYSYDTDPATQQFLLSSIHYSGTGNNSINFNYELRTDTSIGWSANGTRFESNQRLARVDSYANGEIVRSYHLTYEMDTSSLLKKIEECADTTKTTCLKPTTFIWQKLQKGVRANYTRPTSVPFKGYTAGANAQAIDINGDGRQDVAYNSGKTLVVGISQGNKFRYTHGKTLGKKYNRFWKQLDYNGDGKTDLMYVKDWGDSWRWSISISDGEKFVGDMDTGIVVANKEAAENMQVVDINGDALPDLYYKTGIRYMSIDSLGVRSFSAPKNIVFGETPSHWGAFAGLSVRKIDRKEAQVVDFNGDGIIDILAKAKYFEYIQNVCKEPDEENEDECDPDEWVWSQVKSRWTVLVGEQYADNDITAVRYTPYALIGNDGHPGTMPTKARHYKVLDINGDGLADIFYRKSNKNWHVLLNKGQGQLEGFNSAFSIPVGKISNEDYVQFTDYNLDGKTDILYVDGKSNNLRVRLWKGTHFDSAANSILLAPPAGSRAKALRLFLDANGDGTTDYLNLQGTLSKLYLSKDTLKKNHQITRIDNGLGAITEISYKPLTDPNVYTKGEDANMMNFGNGSPVFDIISPMYVVAEATSTSPGITGTTRDLFNADATSTVKYRYKGARLQSGGRGFLGFEMLSTLDPQAGVETISSYLQGFPYTGRPHTTIRRLVSADAWPEILADTGCSGDCLPDICDYTFCYDSDADFQFLAGFSFKNNVLGDSSNDDSMELSRSVNDWAVKTLAGGSQLPYLQKSKEVNYSITSNLGAMVPTNYTGKSKIRVSTVTTTNKYDDYANPTTISVRTVDHATPQTQTKTTTNIYGDSQQYQRYGRLTNTTVTTTQGSDTDTRESSFEYEAGSMLLKKEIIEPNSPNAATETLITDYQRDTYGNIIKKTTCSSLVSNCGTNTTQNAANPNWINRWETTTYDATGTYPVSTANSLGQIGQTIVSRNNLGQVTDATDIFGTHSIQEYDAFGFLTHSKSDTGTEQWSGRVLSSGVYGTKVKQTTVTLGAPTKVQYSDALGRVVRAGVKGFDGTYVYQDTITDTLGRVRFASTPHTGTATHWTESIFDTLGRVIETKQPDGFSNTLEYNGLTQLSTIGIGDNQINGGAGLTKSETKNALGQLSNITDAIGGSIDYEYDLYGKLRYMYSHNAANTKTITTEIQYDGLGRKTKTIDPNMGTWIYAYNALGEITRQTDAKGQVTESYYDSLGRVMQRVDKNSAGTIVADSAWAFDSAFGYLVDVANSHDSNYLEVYEYDTFGRLKEKKTVVDNKPYTQYTWYDNAGRVSGTATRIASGGASPLRGPPVVANEYNSNGYLEQLRNTSDNSIVWKVTATDTFGNVTTSESGNGRYISNRGFNPVTGLIESQSVQRSGGAQLQQLSYRWDTFGNLRSREDLHASPNILETFGYDQLNRLKDASIGAGIKSYLYDDFGNITQKDGNNYLYEETGSAGPHAVTKVGANIYTYDANGNQISGDGRTLNYATFGKPTQIVKGSTTVQFDYDPSRSRYKKRSYLNGNLQETKITAAGVEVIYKDNTAEVRTYIADALLKFTYTGSSIFPTQKTQYLFKDHLGSTDTVVTPNGTTDDVVKMSFGSFGERRNVNSNGFLSLAQTPILLTVTDKGYTGHEQLGHVGLIHMNGRVYDPALGRFLSADPHIQAPTDTQSLNRYSYVLNNPLSATDPSGYFFKKFIKKYGRTLAGIALGYVTFGLGTGAWSFEAIGNLTLGSAISWGAAAGAVSGGVTSGTLRGAFSGAVSGALFGAIGGAGFTKVEAFAVSGLAGGVLSDLQGGKFGHGFLSAGVGAVSGGLFGNKPYARVVGSAIVGGTLSAATGGKFANGAVTAGFAAALRSDWGTKKYLSGNIRPIPTVLTENQRADLDARILAVNKELTERQHSFGSEKEAANFLHERVGIISKDYDVEIGASIQKGSIPGSVVVFKIQTDYYQNVVGISSRLGFDILADFHSHGSTKYSLLHSTFSDNDLDGNINGGYGGYLSAPNEKLYYFNYNSLKNSGMEMTIQNAREYVE